MDTPTELRGRKWTNFRRQQLGRIECVARSCRQARRPSSRSRNNCRVARIELERDSLNSGMTEARFHTQKTACGRRASWGGSAAWRWINSLGDFLTYIFPVFFFVLKKAVILSRIASAVPSPFRGRDDHDGRFPRLHLRLELFRRRMMITAVRRWPI